MKRVILLVAFGASSVQGRSALQNFDAMVRERLAGLPVRWAYTSLLLRERLTQARQKSDSVVKALNRLTFERFDEVAVQPLQTIAGREHAAVCAAAGEVAAGGGIDCRVGMPLLTTAADVQAVARAIVRHLPEQRNPAEDVVFMGHGARYAAVALYEDLACAVRNLDEHVHIGAMNGATGLEKILSALSSNRVWLMPLLSVVGRHALQDMAGEHKASWRSRIEADGRQCVPVLKGIAEYDGFAEIWLGHLEDLVQSFTMG
ncbi:sirohydrochlorin cobaltochelatase CbiKC [Deltaproteobacteria bacterium]|nr:sirohydrochlorin cobaltochelatase CbiKC [Deltaproteobacteria bacterium]